MNTEENVELNTVPNAAVMRALPGFTPNVTSTPLMMIVSAVSVQMTMVSINTSKMP